MLLATTCSQSTPAPRAGRPVTSLNEIAGSWDIRSFDGHTPERLSGGLRQAYVNVSPDRLGYAIGCNASGNAAHVDRKGTLHDDEGGRTWTLRSCSTDQAARDRKLFRFFATLPEVRWVDSQRVELTNGTTALLLERPELRRLSFIVPPNDLAGGWVPQTAIGRNPTTGSTSESFTRPERVAITSVSLEYSGCGGVRFAFRYKPDGRMVDVVEDDPANCDKDFASATLVKIMKSNPRIERDGQGIALTAGEDAVSLKNEDEEVRILRNPPEAPPVPDTPPSPSPPPAPPLGRRN